MARGAEGRYATLHLHIPIQMEEVSRRDKYVPCTRGIDRQTETETDGKDNNRSSSQPTNQQHPVIPSVTGIDSIKNK